MSENSARETSLSKELSTIFRSRPIVAVAFALGLGLVAERVPALEKLRFLSKGSTLEPQRATEPRIDARVGEATLENETTEGVALDTKSAGKATLFGGKKTEDLAPIAEDAPPLPLELFSNEALDGFFRSLSRTHRREPGAITRIAHFGDSVVVSDYVSGTLRRKFQRDFGDAGHGYVLIANAWPAYFHNDVFRFATSGFTVSRIVGPYSKDGLYGLGGVSFRGTRGTVAQFGTAEKGEFGKNVSRFVLDHLAHPEGGTIELFVDGKLAKELDTHSDTVETRHFSLDVPDGPHRLEMRVRSGVSRTFGVALERSGPGVVYDALGVQGARIRFLDQTDDAHFAKELQLRDPSLVVFQFGANESGDGYAYPMEEYQKTMQAVLAQVKRALPDSSCLIVSAMDRARVEHGEVTSMQIIKLIVAEQRKAAEALGCAYFDTYGSMGGFGSMPRWVKRELAQTDMTHPTYEGSERVATWIYQALMKNYATFLAKNRYGGSHLR